MANVILIPGTFHGGWYWEPLANKLRTFGNNVFTPTLSGLELEGHEKRTINLDTHINDVLQLIEEKQLNTVVLVGWSYGGMVITGVADRTNAKVQLLVYLDAMVPKPGQREWDLVLDEDKEHFLAMCSDGLTMQPPSEFLNLEPRMRPHPLATKLQPLSYNKTKFDMLNKIFVFAEKWFHNPEVSSPLKPVLDRIVQEPGWITQSWPFGHDLLKEAPDLLIKLLLENIGDWN